MSSSSSSLMSLPHLVATLQMQHGPACPLGHLWFWGCGHACHSHLWLLVIVWGMVVIVVLAGHLQSSIWHLFVGRWLSVADCCPLCVGLSRRWAGGIVLGSWCYLWWCGWHDVACRQHGGRTQSWRRGRVVVRFGWAFVVVCGWRGLLVVIEVTCGQGGGVA